MKLSLRQRRVLKGLLALLLCAICAAGECNCPCLPESSPGSVTGLANGEASIRVPSGSQVELTALFTGLAEAVGSSAEWSQLLPTTPRVPLQEQSSNVTVFTAPEVLSPTLFQFTVSVGFLSDVVDVTVVPDNEGAPREVPIVNLQVIEGDSITLDGAAILAPTGFNPAAFNPLFNPVRWTQTASTPAGLASRLLAQPLSLFATLHTALLANVPPGPVNFAFDLNVFDTNGNPDNPDTAVASAVINVEVLRRPIADAGPYQLVIRQQTQNVQLDGSASIDMDSPDDDSGLLFLWVQIEGPAVQLSTPLIATPEFSIGDLAPNRNHRLVFALAVIDGPAIGGPILAATSLEEVQAAVADLLADVDTVEIAVVLSPGGPVAPEDDDPEEELCDPACVAPAECVDGMCLIPCDDEFCELDQVCGEGGCVEPCGEGFCEPGEVCTDDGCLIPCGEGFCSPGEACNEDDVCVIVCGEELCEPGQTCSEGGACGEPCGGDVCAPGEACIDGEFCAELCDGEFCGFEGFCDPGCGCDFDGDEVGDLCDECPDNPFATEEPCLFPQ